LTAWVSDLEAVIDAAGLDRFALLGISQGGPLSVAYAAKHPERVTRLVLHGGFAKGWVGSGSSTAALEQH
jgi:pimeloyl-ACP methyl ester carboxylesterase